MNYKVGQRVKSTVSGGSGVFIAKGDEGSILALPAKSDRYYVGWDTGARSYSLPEVLAPLLPPAADTWAADKVKQLVKPIHQEPAVARDNAVCW